ncbi:MAG: hypothetical protein KDA58_16040, partial [Planctomycetaceae bacterium]|nr:hypothetical protein [Planctomycetaceae bacterium]
MRRTHSSTSSLLYVLLVLVGPWLGSGFAEEGTPDAAAATESTPDAAAKDSGDPETQDALLAGHSAHGEIFNEGPRQAAYLFPGNGDVSFPATCATPEVQQFINQGVAQLHGFWYFESERSFRQAAALDPECA